jgi:hypothetical protein
MNTVATTVKGLKCVHSQFLLCSSLNAQDLVHVFILTASK